MVKLIFISLLMQNQEIVDSPNSTNIVLFGEITFIIVRRGLRWWR